MASAAASRLQEERRQWRKDHPPGMTAKPTTAKDGSTDIFVWDCKVPGMKGTFCEGGLFPFTIKFSPEHPHKPPLVFMPKGFFHVNVFDDGGVCLSILKEVVPKHLGDVSGWRPSFTVKQILIAMQELLSSPNFGSVANFAVAHLKARSEKEYLQRMKDQTAKYKAEDDEDA
ncbi:hypothetical protein CHLRE_01g019450v5 [Chlamydomonas reinhardtii]|uniref:UBC core domain-containing protein n=1 Tax=Chlamydomonas reinhardtii TaxID=3055 RepID=A0A2K3E622_CHLRE|nr:uncharacterized protein CHLRE_01g019450v5 [Chlamydomonas reinhardtii]PNW88213.1 hypothetical protein CHLRE_01g019450v5 [Chlamydomonas reinhardtii]